MTEERSAPPQAADLPELPPDRALPGEYNYEHFRTAHVVSDAVGTVRARGIQPGEEAPDFELPMVGGGTLRLSSLRNRPTLLHFGSFT